MTNRHILYPFSYTNSYIYKSYNVILITNLYKYFSVF